VMCRWWKVALENKRAEQGEEIVKDYLTSTVFYEFKLSLQIDGAKVIKEKN
jgi:hypothetical protein